jgi:hypothetical protein
VRFGVRALPAGTDTPGAGQIAVSKRGKRCATSANAWGSAAPGARSCPLLLAHTKLTGVAATHAPAQTADSAARGPLGKRPALAWQRAHALLRWRSQMRLLLPCSEQRRETSGL